MFSTEHNEQIYASHHHNPQTQLLSSILSRLQKLQQNALNLHPLNQIDGNVQIPIKGVKNLPDILSKMNRNYMNNLQILQKQLKNNIQTVVQRFVSFEQKTFTVLKHKQHSLTQMQSKINGLQSLLRGINREGDEGVGGRRLAVCQQRINSLEEFLQVKDKSWQNKINLVEQSLNNFVIDKIKESEHKILKIIENKDEQKENEKLTEIEQRLKQLEQSSKNKNFDSQTPQTLEIAQKVKVLELQLRECRRKCTKFEQQIQNTLFEVKQLQSLTKSNTDKNNFNRRSQNQLGLYSNEYQNKQKFLGEGNNLRSQQLQRYPRNQRSSRNQRNSNKKDTKLSSLNQSDEDPFNQQVIGIRGLLKKSKQKQQRLPSRGRNPLPPPKRLQPARGARLPGLGEVKPSPRKNIYSSYGNSDNMASEEDSGQEYGVDEDGFLIDQQGNYLQDQNGNRVQISQQQMQQLLNEQQNY